MPESYEKEHRVFWTDAEWMQVAREIYRQNPVDQILRSSTLLYLDRQAVLKAQQVLPKDRQRNIQAVTTVRPKILQCMARIRAEVDASIAVKEAQQKAEVAPPPLPEVNPYEAIFAPLVDLIAARVCERMQDMLAQVFPQVSNVQLKPVQGVPRKPKFAVVGPLGVQAQEIRKAYPEVDFITIESSKAVKEATVAHCDRIIGMTDFMEHAADGMLRKQFGDKYHRTTGSTSSVKRLVGILLNSMRHEQRSNLH